MKVKTNTLSGIALDWLVAKALDYDVSTEGHWDTEQDREVITKLHGGAVPGRYVGDTAWCPSTCWAQGGPLIQREKMTLSYDEDGQTYSAYVSLFRQRGMSNRTRWRSGPTPLIAAMRAFCCSLLGDEVDIPEELLP